MEEIIGVLNSVEELDFETSFQFAQRCSIMLSEDAPLARKIIINVLNNWKKIPSSTFELWIDLIEAVGFYPYISAERNTSLCSNLPGKLRHGLHASNYLKQKFFHEEQLEFVKLLDSDKNVIVSAPTSFGKSLLIEEVVASKRFKNIIIIQPTLALLDETRRKLVKYQEDYKLIIRTSQAPSESANIFLFTAERVNEYNSFPIIDFLVIDEFYKLSGKRDDERSSSLNNAFRYILSTYNPKFYLLGPNIDGISEGFEKKYNSIFKKSYYSLVDSRSIDIYRQYEGKFGKRGEKKKFKEQVLFELLVSVQLQEQTIIYCSSPNRVRYLSKCFTQFLVEKGTAQSVNDYPLGEWIEENVSKDWSILKNLRYDIGIHDGALQKHITSTIIDYFNEGKIKYLFCTSTIIEGVNTSAKNIIYFDPYKGLKPNGQQKEVDFFDYSNIKGRAGRMMVHYVGQIFNFNKPPEDEKIIVDIPFHQQNPIKDEVLIQIPEEDILDKNEQFRAIKEIPPDEREIIKKNGVKVHGQRNIFNKLRNEIAANYDLICWTNPSYPQLTYVLTLAWDYLILEGETTRPMTIRKLVNLTFNYASNRNIGTLVLSNYEYARSLDKNKDIADSDLLDTAIQETFQIMKHWFEYKIPKWLSVINEIQRFVCSEKGLRPGSYIHYANLIENDFLRENLAILAEYGIPGSAIRKIQDKIPSNLNQDEVLSYIQKNNLISSKKLLKYERMKIEENLPNSDRV